MDRCKEAFLDRVARDVEGFALRIASIMGTFAKQKVAVQLGHYWELEHVRSRFADFKKQLSDFEDADDLQTEAVEASWSELVRAVDTLQSVLSDSYDSLRKPANWSVPHHYLRTASSEIH